MARANANNDRLTSAGHRLGQVVGDWWETKVILPLLRQIATELNLFVDNRAISRKCRKGKVQWADVQGNFVDYDFVLELGGSRERKGIPVGFFESFWRGGARHSKDKARDDTNKLLPMRDTYPTARFLAIAACGEFTEPAREYVRSRNVELFYVAKSKVVEAFQTEGLRIDYPDSLSEKGKSQLAAALEESFTPARATKIANHVRKLSGNASFQGFKSRVIGALTALPQEIQIAEVSRSDLRCFTSVSEASKFLSSRDPQFSRGSASAEYSYKVVYNDGTEFERILPSLEETRRTHSDLAKLVTHVSTIVRPVGARRHIGARRHK